jgi:glycosyltransferase involved in cell wall biosynthesis
MDLRRELRALRRELDGGSGAPLRSLRPLRVVASTAAYPAARPPRVSVVTALYNHGRHVEEALESVRVSRFRDVECIVVDDGSTDDGAARVEAFLRAHPEQAGTLLAYRVNRGLPAARNAGLAFARGEYVFVLDADNTVYPTGLGALVAALDGEPEAAMAYGMLQSFDSSGQRGLVSYLPWEPDRLRAGNYIDAMAMFRASILRAAGGYSTDRRLHGWEDYDLWLTLAELGHLGVLVPSIVGRYRVSPGSMLSITNVSIAGAFAALTERHPALLARADKAQPAVLG